MEPDIQYVRAPDGTTIAYAVVGHSGTPLIYLPSAPFTHVQLSWQLPETAAFLRSLGRERRIILYDVRGAGLSQRDVSDLTFDARLSDLAAVVDRAVDGMCAVYGAGASALVALAYAARNPERVSHLLVSGLAATHQLLDIPQWRAMGSLADADWDAASETIARLVFGWAQQERSREFATIIRAAMTHAMWSRYREAMRTDDVTPLLSMIRARTMITHREGHAFPSLDTVRATVAAIPQATLRVVADYDDAVIRAVDDFLQDRDAVAPSVAPPVDTPSGTAVIVFADIVDSTGITERVGDAAFRERARTLDERLRSVIRAAAGTPVEGKLLGDGVLAVFTSARQAIDAALRCAASGDDLELQLHVGIHAGDVIREGDNVFGGAVNITSRISGLSAPNEVLVSATVRDLARTSAGVTFEDRGKHALKGIDDPQRVFAVRSRPS
jgi:class 3 adenylate cyclase